ncbi:MAG: type II secretion system protein [Planctomycetota bacterium]|nr:MAG: type II secretion system protein [Planctomycetota bacterium]
MIQGWNTSEGQPQRGFTLIELMVVIAIIGLLVAILLPAFGTVRTKVRVTQTTAQFSALDQGLETYRGESELGGSYPPSASDRRDDPGLIANPGKVRGLNGQKEEVRICGGHLLFQAMLGADMLGTPGFRDFNGDGNWWNDTHDDPDTTPPGAYALDTNTGKVLHTRYGGGGYVSEDMKDTARSLQQLADDGVLLNLDEADTNSDLDRDDPLFVDSWGRPILYYRARRGAARMVYDVANNKPGIYRQADNNIITGSDAGEPSTFAGMDFGDGLSNDRYHELKLTIAPQPTDKVEDILVDPSYLGSFALFILDPSTKSRPTPVNKDRYLLISAGPDGRFGNDDDITNWTRQQP